MRVPSSASMDGTTRTANSADSSPTAAPAAPTEYRKRCGMSMSAASAIATVRPEKTTVRPAVSDRAPVRLLGRAARALELLAVARDEQQPVVDGQAEAQRGGDVQREQRRVHDARHHPQHEERAEHRDDPEQQRDRRRDDAAEDEQQQDREDREGDHLRPGEIVTRLVVDLVEADRETAHAHVERAVADPPLGLLGRLAAVALDVLGRQAGGDDERAAVAREQRARPRGGRAAGRRRDRRTRRAQLPAMRATSPRTAGAATSSRPPPGSRTRTAIAGLAS